jgi:hypothetical protein
MSETTKNATTSPTTVEQTPVESKLHLKINEDPKDVDFTFSVPNGCSWEFVKRAIMGTFEHVVRLEIEDIRVRAEKAATEKASDDSVQAEVVS